MCEVGKNQISRANSSKKKQVGGSYVSNELNSGDQAQVLHVVDPSSKICQKWPKNAIFGVPCVSRCLGVHNWPLMMLNELELWFDGPKWISTGSKWAQSILSV